MHVPVHLPDAPGSVVLADVTHQGTVARRTLVRESNCDQNLHWYAHAPVADGSWFCDEDLSDPVIVMDAGDVNDRGVVTPEPESIWALRSRLADRMDTTIESAIRYGYGPVQIAERAMQVIDDHEIRVLRSCEDEVTVEYAVQFPPSTGLDVMLAETPIMAEVLAKRWDDKHPQVVRRTVIRSPWNTYRKATP